VRVARRPDRRAQRAERARYPLRFGLGALGLVGATLVLVLFVLPERYILSSGFAESGLTFPASRIPFVPVSAVRVAAPEFPVQMTVMHSTSPEVIVRGPAEVFWDVVLPLLEAERFGDALPSFERYLATHTDDAGARREYARALVKAGRGAEAVTQFEAVLTALQSPDVRLELARTLRDLGCAGDAEVHYALLRQTNPSDVALALESARSFSWIKRYAEAERVLLEAIRSDASSTAYRVELARLYYYTNRLKDADALLGLMSDDVLIAHDAFALRNDVRTALTPAAAAIADRPRPGYLERAMAARDARHFDASLMLIDSAARIHPDDPAVWIASANVRQYELDDYAGARASLMRAEQLGGLDASLALRLAQLDAWTGHAKEALARLDALAGTGDTTAMSAIRRTIRNDVTRGIIAAEVPRAGTRVMTVADADAYTRTDVAAEWVGVRNDWTWNATVGYRTIDGPASARAAAVNAVYAELSPARWWKMGALRTGMMIGAQSIDGRTDVSLGINARYRAANGAVLGTEMRHEPGYLSAGTVQSAYAGLSENRATITYGQSAGRWYVAAQADASRLSSHVFDAESTSTRTQGVLSVSRAMRDAFSLGWSSSVLAHSAPAPAPGGRRLFWDPALEIGSGPFARVAGRFANAWEGSLRLNPGLAFVKEFESDGRGAWIGTVPRLSAEAGLAWKGRDFTAGLDLFYSQTRADGYRIYGLRFSLNGASPLSDRVSR
jgi:tetratricopeptide (TPR) repeat protein